MPRRERQGCLGFLLGGLVPSPRWGRHHRRYIPESAAPPYAPAPAVATPPTVAVPAAEPLPYRVQRGLLSPAEISFFQVMRLAIGDRYLLFSKVRLGDIFYVQHVENRMGWINKINAKHVDFLLCDPLTLQPVAGLELDDASHERADRQERDQFVDEVFAASSLTLVHVPARRSYTPEDIRESLRQVEEQTRREVATTRPMLPGAPVAPLCPHCHLPMVLRTAAKGERSGEQFWGCVNYPRCREMRRVE